MCVQVCKILWLCFVVSLVHAHIHNNRNNEGYRPNLKYEIITRPHKINHNHNVGNSYQYLHRLRHSHTSNNNNNNNRYPNMDNILTRMSNTQNAVQLKPTENPFRKLYVIPGITTEGPEYEEIEDKNGDTLKTHNFRGVQNGQNGQDGQENQDDEDQDEDEDPEDEEDDYDESEADDWQAEEATEAATEKTLTDYKWKHFGTRSRVDESFKNQGITSKFSGDVQQAITHARKVVQQGACKTPRIRLVKIQSVYPDAGKAYIPHCTLLHRCSDETGCCRTDSLTCAPKETERIELHFYTGRPGNYKVEKLAFYNHTECHCVEKPLEVMSGDAAPDEDPYPLRPGPSADLKVTSIQSSQTLAEPLKRCQCPGLYAPEISHRNCRCDCKDGNRDCMRIKRGKEFFALKDRLCIAKRECGNPACEFGVYIERYGRCPRKQEKFESFSKISTQ